LLVLAIFLAFGFWFAHLQWWWKANDDSVHQYFNALKLSQNVATADLNQQALVAMRQGGMEGKRLDRLKLRIQVTYNWLLTSVSINGADSVFRFVDSKTGPPDAFPKQLVSSEITGFFVAFALTALFLILFIWARFDPLYLQALVIAFALMFAMALANRTLSTEFAAIVSAGAAIVFVVFRRLGPSWGIGMLALITFVMTYGILNALVAANLYGANLGEIVQAQGGLFEFVAYSLDTILYPDRCCSPFGYFARSNFNLLLILVFALRWSNRHAASYFLLASMSVIHLAQTGLAVLLLIAADLLLRPKTLGRKPVLAGAALALIVFLARQGAWPKFAWFTEHAMLLVVGVLAAGLLILLIYRLAGDLEKIARASLGPVLRLRGWILDKGPVAADLIVVGLGWLGLSLLLLAVVKWLGQEALEEMSYLSRGTLIVTPRRLLSMLQAPFIFGLVLLWLRWLDKAPERTKAAAARWSPRLVLLAVLVLWGQNLARAGLDPFPARQIERMERLHARALAAPPYPDRDFDEARMYYLMALYARSGHYVENGFFQPSAAAIK